MGASCVVIRHLVSDSVEESYITAKVVIQRHEAGWRLSL